MLISCDPGLTGGAISLLKDADTVLNVWDMPVMPAWSGKGNIVNPYLVSDIIKECIEKGADNVIIEQQIAMPSQSSTSTGKTFTGFGILIGVVSSLDLKMKFVRSQNWKKYHGLTKLKANNFTRFEDETTAENKNRSRLLAIEFFPDQYESLKRKKDEGRAESMLIGRYAFSLI